MNEWVGTWLSQFAFQPDREPSDWKERRRWYELRGEIADDLREYGFGDPEQMFRQHDLARIAIALAYVQDQRSAGVRVRNPAGLVMWKLKQAPNARPPAL
ncbi:MAG TPA: hypothetical protein VFH17_07995 [Coriobacteriia bacterium]|nr:hypothetical protein [Coriobacteriia bacterium]